MEVRRPIRDRNEWEKGDRRAKPQNRGQGCHGLPLEQQNVKAVPVRHCTVTTTPHNCCPNCYAEQSHKDNVRSSAIGKQLKQRKSNSPVQHHLPALDLFWASLFMRVQLTSLLLISPGLYTVTETDPLKLPGDPVNVVAGSPRDLLKILANGSPGPEIK